MLVVGCLGTSSALAQASLPADVTVQAQQVNDAFAEAVLGGASREETRARLAGLDPSRWPDGVAEVLISAINTKAERYGDIHQSMLLGVVVRTPLSAPAGIADQMAATDERVWSPLLEAAARGEPVTLPDSTVSSAEETYFLAITAAHARIMVMEVLEARYGLEVTLTMADRELATAADWIGAYTAASQTPTAAPSSVEALNLLYEVTALRNPPAELVERALAAAAAHPEAARSYLLFTWLTDHVTYVTDRWLIELAQAPSEGAELREELNSYRRLLGLPIVLSSDLDAVRQRGALPWWSDSAYADELQTADDDAAAALSDLSARYASVAVFWTPPTLAGLP
jgi:hypothetical protein